MSVTADAPRPVVAAAASKPKSGLQHYRHLTLELAISQFKLRYTGSALGYLWSLLKPAMTFGTMYFIFTVLFKVRDHTPFFGLQLLLGIVVWTFFSECIAYSMAAIAGTGHLIRKAYFPRSILVIAASMTSLFTFAINLTLVAVIALLTRQIDLGPRILAVIPLFAELYLLVLGISLFLSALVVQFRDVGHLWEVVSQVLFYGSAVLYSLTFLKEGNHYTVLNVLAVNPVAQIVEDFRHAVITPQAPWTFLMVPTWSAVAPFVLVGLALVIGGLTFRNRAPHLAENL
jgi:ABC-2 type transport system permease protein